LRRLGHHGSGDTQAVTVRPAPADDREVGKGSVLKGFTMRMQSKNPALSRVMAPSGGAGTQPHGQYGSSYGQAYQQGYGQPSYAELGHAQAGGEDTRPMTIDDVVIRTGMVLLAVVAAAAVSYFLQPEMMWLTWVGALGGLVL